MRVISHNACWVTCFISEHCEDTYCSHGEVKTSHTSVETIASLVPSVRHGVVS